jgi:AMP nucleosidase
MKSKSEIAKGWLKRYTGSEPDELGDWILLTNFQNYVDKFADKFNININGLGGPMTSTTNSDGLSIINFGYGSANAATIMDLLSSVKPRGVLFLGKCGGLKKTTEIGHFVLPIAAIRGEGTSDDYFPPEVPAMPSFKLHKYVSQILLNKKLDYRTGVVYTTNRRIWEWDLLLVSDRPMIPDGIKTAESDQKVTKEYANLHLEVGIQALTKIDKQLEKIKHFRY